MFFVLAFVLLLVLPSPWRLIGFAVCLALAGGEVAFWSRKVRKNPASVGAQTLLGTTAKVISACRPDGQVQISGEIWEARCPAGADRGDTVTVVGRDRLTLLVEPGAVPSSAADTPSQASA